MSEQRPRLGAYATADAVHYVFLEPHGPVRESYARDAGHPLPAFASRFPIFAWDEREMADGRGVTFEHMADARAFRFHGGAMPRPVVAQGEGVMQIVVGPVHAGIIEPGRFTFSSGGETVVHLDAQLGYGFRGVERALEGTAPLAAAARVARICGSCSAARSHAYALAVETLAKATVDADAALGRLVICELERVYNHLHDLAQCASAAGWAPGLARGMALKERAMRLNASASGHRLLFDAIVPGGCASGVLREPERVCDGLAALAADVERYLTQLFANGSVLSRWRGAGIVSHERAAAFGAVGPAARASGQSCDVRAFAPYGAYRELAPSVATARGGDVLARCRVKRAELREALRLAADGLAVLRRPPPAPQPLTPASGVALACVEGPRGAETIALHLSGGTIERLHAISASYRNWPLVAGGMDGNIVPDFPLVNKSFNLCYACADR